MRIGFVRVFVTDLKKSLQFYTQDVGLEIDFTDERNWAQFKTGDDVSLAIELSSPDHMEMGSKMVGRFVGVTMMVDNIVDTYAKLSGRGVKFTGAPQKQLWGGTMAHFQDLDGNVLTLLQEG